MSGRSLRAGAGVIVDGGPIGRPFQHRVGQDGNLFLFLDVPGEVRATVTVAPGSADFRRPAEQVVVVEFEDDFLVDGLLGPAAGDDADRALLEAIEPTVRKGIIERLAEIFAESGVVIASADEEESSAERSPLTYSGRRKTGDGTGPDELLVGGCARFVIFGELLPEGRRIDAGNREPADRAVVYVGSFRGTQDCDAGLLINSTNNMINALALSGAHEIGHLVGLGHTALDGIMSAAPSFAIQRPLSFQRSQIVLLAEGQPLIITNVIQDPDAYFRGIFAGKE